ncbi:DUF4405 domain-containing protein [Methylotuvimicrobium alcaliphilum]|uniref:Flavinylation-associated cytochrome domain-containing protein n=1 Tax=Methylotuvimicrobium alcaliphilum (strain DSM 19304 / NCIMB 14124 / VKM B-2133 / 20Z) TaxID=1091494 RepID=G4STW3_META2|nr:DUF4405 domain-containing protein [Methylotuvimicrobium alcaliphilum]CCE22786.1 conserved membrane protein of unknown function [Methylotuvimicrobium alcaliphilum 20Z]
MKRSQLNFIIDIVAFAGFVFLTTTGVLLRYLLPPGSGRFATIWGLDRHQWGTVHFWVSVLFFAILALHLLLHWRWVVGFISGRVTEGSGLRLGLGLVGVLTLVAFATAPLVAPIEISGASGKQLRAMNNGSLTIRGSMTLVEIAQITGVPVDYLMERLNLPETTNKTAKLGQLSRQYHFTIADVRKAVIDYRE